jgi:hypothetical protein
MKKILFILLFLCFNSTIFAQTIIGNVKRGPYLIAELSVSKTDSSEVFKLRYLDSTTEILKSTLFKVNQDKIEELYLFFSNMIPQNNGTSNDFKIDNSTINATTQKMMGLRNIRITINESSNFGLNLKEINKLFGK